VYVKFFLSKKNLNWSIRPLNNSFHQWLKSKDLNLYLFNTSNDQVAFIINPVITTSPSWYLDWIVELFILGVFGCKIFLDEFSYFDWSKQLNWCLVAQPFVMIFDVVLYLMLHNQQGLGAPGPIEFGNDQRSFGLRPGVTRYRVWNPSFLGNFNKFG